MEAKSHVSSANHCWQVPIFVGAQNANSIYREYFQSRVEWMGIEQVVTAPRAPFQNDYASYYRLSRRVRFGELVQFSVLDTRQYLTDQSCGAGRKVPCEAVFNPGATMMGAEQEEKTIKSTKSAITDL